MSDKLQFVVGCLAFARNISGALSRSYWYSTIDKLKFIGHFRTNPKQLAELVFCLAINSKANLNVSTIFKSARVLPLYTLKTVCWEGIV
jgi:hypothetical protein